jgi:hypothetical protein
MVGDKGKSREDTLRETIAALSLLRAETSPGSQPVTTGDRDAELVRKLEREVPDTATPGYWSTLEKNAKTWADEVSVQDFWTSANANLPRWRGEFQTLQGAELLPDNKLPLFTGKGAARTKEKALGEIRRNDGSVGSVYPKGGASVPCLNDLVRVRIPTRYLDGVDFLANKLKEHLEQPQHRLSVTKVTRQSGYYACHLHFDYSLLYRQGGGATNVMVKCEIQIATELSTTIWDRTHGSYELSRVKPSDDEKWQWKPDDPQFIATQLGHMIHLADGLVVQLREAVKKRRGK